METKHRQAGTTRTQYSTAMIFKANEIRHHVTNPIDRELLYARLLIDNNYVTHGTKSARLSCSN